VVNAQFVKDSHAKNTVIAFAMPFSMIEIGQIVNWPEAVFYVSIQFQTERINVSKNCSDTTQPCKIWCHVRDSELIRNKGQFPNGSPCGANQFCVGGVCL